MSLMTRRKSTVEQAVGTLVDGILVPFVDRVVVPLISNGGAFVVFGVIWAVVGYAILTRTADVDAAWRQITALNLVAQAALWVLFLPVMAALWVWETSWPLVVRASLVVGLAGWSLLMFVPKWLTAARP